MKFRSFSNPYSGLNKNQVGAVSIYVSFIIMTILTLISLTFAQIMSDHYVQIAESQYDLQAHYAAESAISSVRSTIHRGLRDREQVSGANVEVTVEYNSSVSVPTTVCPSLDGYGASLDVEGNLLVVGAPNTSGIGAVCLLTKNDDAADWSASNIDTTATEKIDASGESDGIKPLDNANFGASVALSSSGDFLAIGAPEDRSSRGSVYIFQKIGTDWGFINKIVPYADNASLEGSEARVHNLSLTPNSIAWKFGAALVWSGDSLLVGAPGKQTVYLLQKNKDTDKWENIGDVNITADEFGSSLVKASIVFPDSGDDVANFVIGSEDMIYLTRIDGNSFGDPKQLCSSGTCLPFSNFQAFYVDGSKLITKDGSMVNVWERESSSKWDEKYEIGKFPTASKGQIHVGDVSNQFGQALVIKDELLAIGDPGKNKIHFLTIKDHNILKDIWAAGFDQDCPAQEDAHKSWRNNTFGEVANISYTCVSVEVDPIALIYDHVGIDRSLILPLEPTEGKSYDDKQLKSLSFYWNHVDGGAVFKDEDETAFPAVGVDWASPTPPVLRVQITPVNHSRAFSRDSLVNNTRVFFLYPNEKPNSGTQMPTVWPDQDEDGAIISGYCDKDKELAPGILAPQPCSVTITMPESTEIKTATTDPSTDDKLIYFVRIQSIYQPAQLSIGGKLTDDTDAHFKNIQAVITATGWSNNVAERIQERIPLRPVYDLPEYGIDSAEDLCKILVTTGSEGVYLDTDRKDLHGKKSCSLKVED